MSHISFRLMALVLAIGSGLVAADQVTMKNGDRLTGTVVKSDEKTLTLKSELAGVVTIPWEAVDTINSSVPLSVGLKGGEVLVGPVTTKAESFEVETTNAGRVTADKARVAYIRSKEEEAAYQAAMERLRNPGLLDLWGGFFDVGYATTAGNADTATFTLGMNAARVSPRDKISTYFNSLYATNSTVTASNLRGAGAATANATRGGIRYDLNVNKKVFTFGFTDLEFDEFQKLDLRFVAGGGFGYRVRKNERTNFDVFGGGSLNKEFFQNNLRRTSGELLLGEELTHKLTPSISLRERWVLFPNLSQTGEYRMQFDAGAVVALNKWLGWQVSLSDRFITNPPPNTVKNDVLFTTGIRLTFQK